MKKVFACIVLVVFSFASALIAALGPVAVAVGGEVNLLTVRGYALPNAFGGQERFHSVVRLGPLEPGRRYEFTLTYDAGDNIGYGVSWVDGNPLGSTYRNFVGTGTGTSTRNMPGYQEKSLFSIDAKSTSRYLYVVIGSSVAWKCRIGLSGTPSGVTPESRNQWGYTYVSDFDASRYSPFLLER